MRWRANGTLPTALMVGFLCSHGAAQAQEACGEVTLRGECENNVLRYCSRTNELVELNCATEFFPAGVAGGVCVEVDATYGFDCALPTGGDCVFLSEDSYIPTFCADPDDGCSIDISNDDGYVCTAGLAACVQPAPGELYQPTCSGNQLYVDCLPGDQPLAIDCAGAGGTCGTDACVMPAGEVCDNLNFVCDGNLICQGYDTLSGSFGTCVSAADLGDAGPAPDAGSPGNPGSGTSDAGPGAETCDGVTFAGECDGTDAVFCADRNDDPNAQLIRYTCGGLEVSGDTYAGTCDILNDWGSWCVFPTDTDCAFVSQTGDIVAFGCGDAQGVLATSACSTNRGCVNDIGSCDPATYVGDTCEGNFLARYCNPWGQFYGVDCAAEGNGTCESDGTRAVCRAGVGGQCETDSIFQCAAGLVCTDTGGTTSVCVDPNAPMTDAGTSVEDAGTPDADAGASPGSDAGSTPSDDAGAPPAEPCNGACGLVVYDACTCGADDPCDWSNDGYCDDACAQVVATSFDDTGDCEVGPGPSVDAGTEPPPITTPDAGTEPPTPFPQDAGTNLDPNSDTNRDATPLPSNADTGCGCNTSSDGTQMGLVGLALFGLFRRRRRS